MTSTDSMRIALISRKSNVPCKIDLFFIVFSHPSTLLLLFCFVTSWNNVTGYQGPAGFFYYYTWMFWISSSFGANQLHLPAQTLLSLHRSSADTKVSGHSCCPLLAHLVMLTPLGTSFHFYLTPACVPWTFALFLWTWYCKVSHLWVNKTGTKHCKINSYKRLTDCIPHENLA